MAELPRKTYTQITQLCARGDSHAEHGRLAEALAAYWAAWDVIPEPKTQWEAATWILGAVGDANFLAGDFKAGRDNLTTALRCPGGMGNLPELSSLGALIDLQALQTHHASLKPNCIRRMKPWMPKIWPASEASAVLLGSARLVRLNKLKLSQRNCKVVASANGVRKEKSFPKAQSADQKPGPRRSPPFRP